MVYELPSSFSGGIQGAVESLKKGTLPQDKNPVVVPPAPIITQEQKTFLPQKPKPVDPNKTPDVFKAKFVAKYPEGVAQDGRKYKDIPAVEIVAKIVRKYPNGVTSDGIPYTDFLPRPASPSDSLEYRLSQIESLYGGPKSQFFTDGKMRGQTEKEKQFTTDVVNRKNEGEIMKTIKAPYRGLESVGQNLAYGTFGAGADVLDLFGGDKLAGKMRKSVEQEKFKTGLTNQNKGLIGGLQSGELSSVIETLSSGAGYLATGAKIPLYLMAIAQGGNLSQEGEEQGQGGFLDKSIAYGTGTLSSVIERMSGQKVIGGLTKAGIKKETATTFVQRMNNYLKSLKPSDFEAGTEIIQQKIENIGRSLMGVDYDKGIQQYFEAGLLGKVLGKVGDKGFSESPITTLPPAAPKAPRVDAKNIETLKTIKVGKRANNNVIRNEERGFDPYTDIATHQEIVPSVDKTGLVRTTEQVQNLEDTLDPINDALTQSIKDEGVKISLDEFLLDSMNEAKQYENEGASYDRYVNQIKKDFEVYKRFTDEQGRIDLSKINEIKKAKYGISNFSDVESDKANKMVGKAAKELVEKYTTGESTKAINRELSRWYSARDLLLAMDGKTVKGGRLGKMAARVGGNIIGSYFGPLGSFAGGEISAAVQGQMMKGSLRKPSGTIDSESVLSKIPKRTTPQLPPPSGKPTSAKVVDVKPITGFLPGLLQKSESALSRQISSNNTEDKTTQSQLVRVLGGKRKKEVVLPKKESAGKKVNNPIIQKLAKKQETPKTPQVEGETLEQGTFGGVKGVQPKNQAKFNQGDNFEPVRVVMNDKDARIVRYGAIRGRGLKKGFTSADNAEMKGILDELNITREEAINRSDEIKKLAREARSAKEEVILDLTKPKQSLPLSSKSEVKEAPKTPQVEGETVEKIKAMQLEQEDMIRKGESISEDFRNKWNDLQSQYKKEFIDSRIASERKKVDSAIRDIETKIKENPSRTDWGKKQIQMEKDGFEQLKKGNYFDKKYQEHILKMREDAKKQSLLKGVKERKSETPNSKRALPMSQKSDVGKTDDYFYHGTSQGAFEQIQKEGIKPQGRGVSSLSKTEEYSRNWAFPEATGTKGVMLRVKKDFMEGKLFNTTKQRPKSDEMYELLTKETIPPEALEVLKDGKWVALTKKPALPMSSRTPVKYGKVDDLASEARKYKSAEEFVKDKIKFYHGTNAKFEVFDKSKIKIDNLGKGFYFFDDKTLGETYAKRRTMERGGIENVIEASLDMKKPFDLGNVTREQAKSYLEWYFSRGKMTPENVKKYTLSMLDDKDVGGKYEKIFPNFLKDAEEWFTKEGYDSLIVPGGDKATGKEGLAYVVFEPSQIKTKQQLLDIWNKANKNKYLNFSQKSEVKYSKPIEDNLVKEARKYKSAEEFVKAQGEPVYHGGNVARETFDIAKAGSKEQGHNAKAGFWFAKDINTAKGYGKNVTEIFPEKSLKNPKIVDADGETFGDMRDIIDDAIAEAKKNGNDGVIFKNLSDEKDWGNYNPTDHYVIFNPESIITKKKLLDTYNKANKK